MDCGFRVFNGFASFEAFAQLVNDAEGGFYANVGFDENFFNFFEGFFVDFWTPPKDFADFLYHAFAGFGQSFSQFVD